MQNGFVCNANIVELFVTFLILPDKKKTNSKLFSSNEASNMT